MPAYGVYRLILEIVGTDKTGGIFRRLLTNLGSIARYATAIIGAQLFMRLAEGIAQMGRAAFEAVAFFENMQLSLASLAAREMVQMSDGMKTVADVWDAATIKGKELSKELANIAILSPYTVESTQQAFRMGMAFGFTTDQALVFTEAILRQAAGIGATNSMLDRMAYNLAQIRLQNKVTKLDIRQLALAGFDLLGVLKYVGEQMNVNIKDHLDFNAAIEQGTITWEDFTKYFDQYTRENFEGATERMARSLYGLRSTFHDVFVLTLPQMLLPAAESITAFLNKILDRFIALRESGVLEEWAVVIKKRTDEVLRVIEGFLGWLEDVKTPEDKFRLFMETFFPQVDVDNLVKRIKTILTYSRLLKERLLEDFDFLIKGFGEGVSEFRRLWAEFGQPVVEFAKLTAKRLVDLVKIYALFGADSSEFMSQLEMIFGKEAVKRIQELPDAIGKAFEAVQLKIQAFVDFLDTLDWEAITGNLTTVGENVVKALGEIDFGGIISNIFQSFGEGEAVDPAALIEGFFQTLAEWSETLPSKMAFLNTVLLNLSNIVGGTLLPALGDFATWALENGVAIITILGGLRLALLLFGLTSQIVSPMVLGLIVTFGGLGPALSAIGGGIATAGGALLTLSGPIALVGLAIGALAIAWVTNFANIQGETQRVVGMVSQFFTNLGAIVGPYLTPIIETLSSLWSGVLVPAFELILPIIEGLYQLILAVGQVLMAIFMKSIEFTIAIMLKLGATIFEWFIDPLQEAWDLVITMFPEVQTFVEDAINAVVQVFENLSGIIQDVIGWLKNLADTIMGIEIPSWAKRKSPAPIEQTFMGMRDMAQALARHDLPRLAYVMRNMPVLTFGATMPAGVGGGYLPSPTGFGRQEQQPIQVTIRVDNVSSDVDLDNVAHRVARILKRSR